MSAARVLPAEVFDLLCHSAEAFGGIGADQFTDGVRAPNCAFGHAGFLDKGTSTGYALGGGDVWAALWKVGINSDDNDEAVRRINDRLGCDRTARVPFEAWATELRVVRGPA